MAASMTPGLNPNMRVTEEGPPELDGAPIDVQLAGEGEGEDQPVTDKDGNIIKIEHADGAITISLDGKPIANLNDNPNPPKWFDNLVDRIDEMQLGIICDDIIRGVEEDLQSRADWIDQRVEGMKMLGLQPDTPQSASGSEDQAVEAQSTVRHPMMLEAVLRFQANAFPEMLPVDGPVKIHDDDSNGDLPRDQLADAYQKDFNHFLTKVNRAYYPDTDRMFLMLGFSGLAFKKIYYCPLRNYPASDTIDANDLIVNNNATSLETAKRITHRLNMKPSTVKRMQILGIYRDVDLSTPNEPNYDALQQEKQAQQGIAVGTMRPEDRDREIYECYCERDISGFEHKLKGDPTGLEVPYRITIDVSSRKILSIVRNYDKGTEEMPLPKIPFVMYIFVPGFGFYPIGLLHIMSNMTNASTAAWRIMLDNGMFANFPGGLIAQGATKQKSMIIRVAPGSFAPVDTQGMPIKDAVMGLPYKTEGMAALMTLNKDIVDQAQRVGMTAEMPSSEGREDVPVGTTLAMIEQAQKVLNAVHKRMHIAQSEELEKIVEVFRDHPESFWKCRKKCAYPWEQETFLRALDDCMLVPKADPNTASHMQRLLKVAALKLLQSQSQTLYDPLAVDRAALEAIGYTNPDRFFAPPAAQAKPPPELEAKQKELEIKQIVAMAQKVKSEADAKATDQKSALGAAEFQHKQQQDTVGNQLEAADLQIKAGFKGRELDQSGEKDLIGERVQLIDVAQNIAVHPESAHLVAPLIEPAFKDVQQRQKELEAKKRVGLNPPTSIPGTGDGNG